MGNILNRLIRFELRDKNIKVCIKGAHDTMPYIKVELLARLLEIYKDKKMAISGIIGNLVLFEYQFKSQFNRGTIIFEDDNYKNINLDFYLPNEMIELIQTKSKEEKVEDIPIKLSLNCFIVPEIYNYKSVGWNIFQIKDMPIELSQSHWRKVLKDMKYYIKTIQK
jgi:hypothetical protein